MTCFAKSLDTFISRNLGKETMIRHVSAEIVDPAHHLTSFNADINAVIVGASGGLGNALVKQLNSADNVASVLALARGTEVGGAKTINSYINLLDPHSIQAAASYAKELFNTVHLVIVASGVLHDAILKPEKTLKALNSQSLIHSYTVNAVGPLLVAKHFIPLFSRDTKTVFAAISARVGSIADNRLGGWYSYRASKSALNQMVRSASIELSRSHKKLVLISLHPGTTATALSEPFQRAVPSGKLFTADYSANRMLQVIDQSSPENSGELVAWDGSIIPY